MFYYIRLLKLLTGPYTKRSMVHKRILKVSKITRVIIIMTIILVNIICIMHVYYIILYISENGVLDTLLLLLIKCIIIVETSVTTVSIRGVTHII